MAERRPQARKPAQVDALATALGRARTGRRLSLFLALYLVATMGMAWRLVTVQVVQASEYRSLAERQSHREIDLPARRGRLYARGGEPLAVSLAAATVYANPRVFREHDLDPTFVAAELSALVGRPLGEIMEQLTKDAGFVYVARQIPRQAGEQVAALNLPGIGVLEEPTRIYPAGGLAAQTVGFAGIDNTGLSGMEAQFDEILAGQAGALRVERAPGGLTINAATRQLEPPVAGTDVVLTLDRNIQHTAERVLAEGLEAYRAKGATALVMDVASGEVLAMASGPGYHPDEIGQVNGYRRRNRVVTDLFEPGSVNKIITVAAALEAELTWPDEVFAVPESWQVADKRFRDSSQQGTRQLTTTQIMAESSNVGTIKIAERVGSQRLYDTLRAFGYGSRTGVSFPGEAAGLLAAPEHWSGTSLPTIAIGQGVSATLLQVGAAFGVIANGGQWVQPTLVRGTVGHDGVLEPAGQAERRQVISPRTASQIGDMLAAVLDEGGTGPLAAVPGYDVVGKTGTAQKPSATRRGYEPGAYVASFVGYAPAHDPQLVVAVTFDEPSPIYGGMTAAPAFSEIMSFALQHRRIPPSDPAAAVPQTGQPAVPAHRSVAESPVSSEPDKAWNEHSG